MNLDQFKRAIKAKLKDKSDMSEWYYERMSICASCEFNTGNIENLSLKDKLRVSHNFGKDACQICSCGVSDKSSDAIESCPRGKWLQIKKVGTDKIDITTDTNKAKFTFENHVSAYNLDYGEVPYRYNSDVTFKINTKNISQIGFSSSCGCTTANPIDKGDYTELEVKYDTKRIGNFSKNVRIDYTEDDKRKQTIITIKGKVNNEL